MSSELKETDVIIVGGGAAGFFAAITCAEHNPELTIAILERGKDVLEKVRISGGGRCNVTHACFDPKELISYYPRGGKELLGPFYQFNCSDTIDWFEQKGIKLKTEEDGRMFPVTDNSETIAQCLIQTATKNKIKILTSTRVESFKYNGKTWNINLGKSLIKAKKLFIGAGSSSAVWKTLGDLGHSIVPAVPSLFTFNIKDPVLQDLLGISVQNIEASIIINDQRKSDLVTTGPVLITHWGLSGPAILKLSAWGARLINEIQYRFDLHINWLYPQSFKDIEEQLIQLKQGELARKQVQANNPFNKIPARLWKKLIEKAIPVSLTKNWADLSKKEVTSLTEVLCRSSFKVNGKSTFKEEFVTAGGVSLKDINLKTFESKICKDLYMAGEILDIDALTGGFNFQAAWTGGYLAGKAMAGAID